MTKMVGGMLAHQIDDWYLRPAGVVQIRKAVSKAGAEMKKSAGRFFRHARITVRSAGDHTFEETEHAAYFRHLVKGGDKMDFGCARVCEANFNASTHQRANQTLCSIHRFEKISRSSHCS